jgi:30S ribosomal protein S31
MSNVKIPLAIVPSRGKKNFSKNVTTQTRRNPMGKGDRRTKRGKIWRGSTGNSRVKKQKKAKPNK